jgi:rhamnosyltransferase
MMKIAVLLATFNGLEYLSQQLISIRAQVDVSVSIFIGDDCSTDLTQDFLNRYAEENPNVCILMQTSEKHKSPAHNFFRILSQVEVEKFDYIFYADQDDVWLPDKSKRAITLIEENNVHCYASNLYIWANDGKALKILNKSQPLTVVDYLFQSASAGCTYCLSRDAAIVLQESLQGKLEETPEKISHDWISYAVTRSYGFEWVIDDSPRILYRQHMNNAYGANSGFYGVLKKFRLIKNGWYRRNILYVSHLCQINETNRTFVLALRRFHLQDLIFLSKNFRVLRRKKGEAFILIVSLIVEFLLVARKRKSYEIFSDTSGSCQND